MLQIGLFMLLLTLLNWLAILLEVVKHTPNWLDEKVTVDEIIENFMRNLDLNRIELLKTYKHMNEILSTGAFLFITYALIIN